MVDTPARLLGGPTPTDPAGQNRPTDDGAMTHALMDGPVDKALGGPLGNQLSGRRLALLIGLSFIVLLILGRPYQGIRHDALLYTAQALHDLRPERFHNDLFFAFGSQDQWTLYGKLYGKLIAVIGIRESNLLGLVVAHLFWWTGLWRLARRLLPAPWRWIAVFFVVAMPADYGDRFGFSYAEPWLTARVPAEAICLWALSFAIERRVLLALLLSLASMTLHPLNGAVGFIAVVMIAGGRFPWWRVFASLIVAFALLQYATPLGFALHPLDPTWRAVLEVQVVYLFASLWTLFTWSKACWVIALPLILHATARHAATTQGPHADVWGRFALIGLTGVICSTLSDIGGHDALWIQLQTWRVLWLLSVMQWLALATLVIQEKNRRPALLWWLALCWLTLEIGGGLLALAIAMLLNARPVLPNVRVVHVLFSGLESLTERYKGALVALTVVAIATWIFTQLGYGQAYLNSRHAAGTSDFPAFEIVLHSRFMAVIVGGMCAVLLLGRRKAIAAYCVVLIVLFAYGVVNFDQRTATLRNMEAQLDDPSRVPFAATVPPGKLVYWDGPRDEVTYPWFLMQTASYFATSQTSGIVFHRETTFDAMRRAFIVGDPAVATPREDETKSIADATAANVGAQIVPGEDTLLNRRENYFAPMTADGIRRACKLSSRDTAPIDFIVSPVQYTALSPRAEWDASATDRFWLYDCRRIDSLPSPPEALFHSSRDTVTSLENQAEPSRGSRHAHG